MGNVPESRYVCTYECRYCKAGVAKSIRWSAYDIEIVNVDFFSCKSMLRSSIQELMTRMRRSNLDEAEWETKHE